MLFGKHINKYYLKYIIYFILGIVALVAVDIYQLKIPEIFGQIIDGLKFETLTVEELKQFMKNMFVIVLVMFTGRFLWRICIFGNGVRIEADLRDDMFRHSEKLSQRYYQENKTGALMALYTNDLQTIRAAFGQGTVMLVDVFVLGTLAFIKMWKMDHLLTIFSTIPLFILALCGGIIGKYMQKKFAERQRAYADLSDFAQESFSGISVIKAFVKEGKELLAFGKINKNNLDKNIEFVKAAMLLQILITFLISTVSILIIGYGGYLVYKNPTIFTIGDLTIYISYFGTLTWPMMAIAQLINLRSQAVASLKRVNTLLNEVPDVFDNKPVAVENLKGKITFQNLTFTYPGTDQPVLKNISLNINNGESVGVIGRTGSGKTTLVDLLLRIYNVEESSIFIDDVDIMKLPIKEVRNNISYVPQDNFLFSTTIRENISFGVNEAMDDEVIYAAKLSDVHENISEFKEGYQTVLGERGVTISGGQKQRTAIARALLKNAPILILDDSVSAVDTKTEETILRNLKEQREGKTTILIAHRISTVQKLDKIILLDEGNLVGFGTHEELLKNPLYEKMVHLQKLEDEVEGDRE